MTSGRSRCSVDRMGDESARSRRMGILLNLIASTDLEMSEDLQTSWLYTMRSPRRLENIPVQAFALFVAIVTQITAIVILGNNGWLCLFMLVTVAPTFLLAPSGMIPSPGIIQIAFAGNHTSFFLFTFLQSKALQLISCSICISYS